MPLTASSLAAPLRHRLVVVSVLAAVLLAGCATAPNSFDPPDSSDGRRIGDESFSARTASGVGVEAFARPGLLTLTLEGPFPFGWPIRPFGSRRSLSDDPSEWPQSTDSVLRLVAAAGAFVEPLEAMVLTDANRGEVLVRFAFLGEAHPDRTICTTVMLKDADGKALKIRTRHHTDKRPSEAEPSSAGNSDIRGALEESNSERVSVIRSAVEQIQQIVVTFEEFK